MYRYLAGFVLVMTLTGCGLPPVITVASTVADGFSYMVSGKSVSDHALSATTAQDCAMLRLLDGDDICIDYAGDADTVLVAAAPAAQPWGPPASPGTAPGSIRVAAPEATGAMTVPTVRREALFTAATPLVRPAVMGSSTGTWTVLGSFQQRANAERISARLAELQPRIVAAQTAQGLRYRVVSAASVADARASGIGDAWSMAREMVLATVL